MSSLVSEFIINPVLRQARRFSEISLSTLIGDVDEEVEDDPSDLSDAFSASPPTSHHHHHYNYNHHHHHSALSVRILQQRASVNDAMAPVETSSSYPPSDSTQEARVDEIVPVPMPLDSAEPRDHLGFPLIPRRKGSIPEDDGMRLLRIKIQAINARDISQSEKAHLMHEALTERYRATAHTAGHLKKNSEGSDTIGKTWELSTSAPAQTLDALKFWQNQVGDGTETEKFIISESDARPSFVPVKQHKHHGSETPSLWFEEQPSPLEQPLGCQHYERNVKLQCFTCKKWYTCRFCHDAVEDHSLIRKETRNMLCMICTTPQRASDTCINCGEVAAQYYCNICKLWENRSNKPIYHCNDCGICRRGLGLGKDFYHCKTCRACISTSIERSHKCIERSTDCDCPICGEYLFTSPRPVVFMACGHSIHKKCYEQHMTTSYKCPICNKSLVNMESQFRNLDVAVQSQPMPPEFRDTTAVILCNDCSGKSTVSYHWLGLKCGICRSYNTVELQILGGDHVGIRQAVVERGEASTNDATTAEVSSRQPAAQNPTSGNISRTASFISRRRHSSAAVPIDIDLPAPDRVARSVSPINVGIENAMSQWGGPESESDSGDDILGLWRGGAQRVDEESAEEDSGSEDEYSDALSGVEEEEEEDDPFEIVLIGHR